MEVLEIDGKQYMKASKAAREAGYTSDYIGQLCRSGAITAHIIGRSWYVNVDELRGHRVEKKRTSRIKATEAVKMELASKRTAETNNISDTRGNHFTRHLRATSVAYSEDTKELIPEVKKLTILSETPSKNGNKKSTPKIEEEADAYEVEHAGEKIIMSGKLSVVDVTDEPTWGGDESAVRLTAEVYETPKPKAAHTKHNRAGAKIEVMKAHDFRKEKLVVSSDDTEENIAVQVGSESSFTDKLKSAEVESLETHESLEHEIPITEIRTIKNPTKGSRIPIFSIATSMTITVLLLLTFLEGEWLYDSSGNTEQGGGRIESNYSFNPSGLVAKIPFKI
jgi:hypothetical protein